MTDIRTRIADVKMGPDADGMADNLAVALCSYFESHPDRPEDDPETERGWSEWAEAMADKALDDITAAASA